MGVARYLVHGYERLEYTAAGHHGGAGRTGLVEVRPVSLRMRYEVPPLDPRLAQRWMGRVGA
jgi:hypothetical protein